MRSHRGAMPDIAHRRRLRGIRPEHPSPSRARFLLGAHGPAGPLEGAELLVAANAYLRDGVYYFTLPPDAAA
ncbi:MAG TPA: hypothetical protein VEI06_12795 [Gemmatimonadaceae bacterium]|nr:hypothetical protein [Gemmatimonadaceae bacterium]